MDGVEIPDPAAAQQSAVKLVYDSLMKSTCAMTAGLAPSGCCGRQTVKNKTWGGLPPGGSVFRGAAQPPMVCSPPKRKTGELEGR